MSIETVILVEAVSIYEIGHIGLRKPNIILCRKNSRLKLLNGRRNLRP